MSKLAEDVRVAILGAAAGLFSSSVTLLMARIDAYYDYLSWRNEIGYSAHYERAVEDLEWIPICLWHILLAVTASLLVHRYLANRFNSPFLLWQVIGITSLGGWVLTFSLVMILRFVMTGELDVERILYLLQASHVAKYAATTFACNVFYGSVINASSRQYVRQLDSQLSLQDRAQGALPY